MNADTFTDSLIGLIYRILGAKDAPVGRVQHAIFVQNNALDANLCDITLLDGSTVGGCPRISGSGTFAAGDPLLVITGPSVPYTVIGKVIGDVSAGPTAAVGDSTAGSSTPVAVPFTKTYNFVWAQSYNAAGGFDGAHTTTLVQGDDNAGDGNRKSLVGFNTTTIQFDLTDATITSCKVKLKYVHWWYSSGGTAVLGTHNKTSKPGSYPGSGVSPNRIQSSSWPINGTRSVELGVSIGNEFKAGTSTGIAIGPGPSSNKLYYGYANGNLSTDVQLIISGTKGGA